MQGGSRTGGCGGGGKDEGGGREGVQEGEGGSVRGRGWWRKDDSEGGRDLLHTHTPTLPVTLPHYVCRD